MPKRPREDEDEEGIPVLRGEPTFEEWAGWCGLSIPAYQRIKLESGLKEASIRQHMNKSKIIIDVSSITEVSLIT